MARFVSDVERRDPERVGGRVTGSRKHGTGRASRELFQTGSVNEIGLPAARA